MKLHGNVLSVRTLANAKLTSPMMVDCPNAFGLLIWLSAQVVAGVNAYTSEQIQSLVDLAQLSLFH